ncbi:hypothetical protein [Microbacterium sp. S1037]|uniref:hypothetical protein n=1 Tax=Microbacterium sp. S1037 TaxID=3398227 RepID=UPI003AAC4A3D
MSSDTQPSPADVARQITKTKTETAPEPTAEQQSATTNENQRAAAAREQITKLERELSQVRREALINRIVNDHKLAREDAILLTAETEDGLITQAQRLQGLLGTSKRLGPIARHEGQLIRNTATTDDRHAFPSELGVSDDPDGW